MNASPRLGAVVSRAVLLRVIQRAAARLVRARARVELPPRLVKRSAFRSREKNRGIVRYA
jgi:hypothetical protein